MKVTNHHPSPLNAQSTYTPDTVSINKQLHTYVLPFASSAPPPLSVDYTQHIFITTAGTRAGSSWDVTLTGDACHDMVANQTVFRETQTAVLGWRTVATRKWVIPNDVSTVLRWGTALCYLRYEMGQGRPSTQLVTLLTPCSRVLRKKLTGSQPVKKFSAFYGTRRFITAFTSARHLSLS